MAIETNEPRALTAALAAPAFVTNGARLAMHVANRHLERWAPEAGADRVRSLRNLGFVDRLVAPWLEGAQRSASLRMFGQYISNTAGERQTLPVSWVFPRPWYQDELDWMAAARQVGPQGAQAQAPSLLTTRGTYVTPTRPAALALPTALYEFVAPSLSVARPDVDLTTERPATERSQIWSPLVSAQAAQAADVMSRAIVPLLGSDRAVARMSPGLRAVLSTMLDRTARTPDGAATRLAASAPELVTPPAPRPTPAQPQHQDAFDLAERSAEQRVQISELQRATRLAEREVITREAPAPAAVAASNDRIAEVATRRAEAAAEVATLARQRLDERIARGAATQRLHEQAREAAVRDAHQAATAPRPVDERVTESVPERPLDANVAAAIAALPPELAAVVAAGLSRRPDRAAQAISDISDALRTVELLARNSAAGGSFESARGPRIVMPVGLGGLVATVDRATLLPAQAAPTIQPTIQPTLQASTQREQRERVPSMAWLVSPRAVTNTATSALGATTGARPAALQHVAWADRWLARFAGARTESLDALSVAAGHSMSPEGRFQLLAASAPGAVFVAPDHPAAPAAPAAQPAAKLAPIVDQPVIRYDDNAETPDDMFVAIAASAARSRKPAVAPVAATAPAPAIDKPTAPELAFERDTLADLAAHAAPAAPGAGLSAQLASSPFAPALHHLMPLGAAPSFDVRALFGTELAATYLAGLLAPATHEIAIASGWAPSAGTIESEREVADWQATYVAPEASRAQFETADSAAPLTTLRSVLLSWDVETIAAQDGPIETRVGQPSVGTSVRSSIARSTIGTMLDAMSLPMLGQGATSDELGGAAQLPSYAAPGMIGDRAHTWSVAQERSSADLAFDFVTPELVLAARVYGLGPAEAAQAARLAIVGPGQLAAMATTVDRTFVQALTIDAERKQRVAAITAYPAAYPAGYPAAYPAAYPAGDRAADRAGSPAATRDAGVASHQVTTSPSKLAFGVDRRMPRGAFLWPATTISALGLNATVPDGEQSMSVAALELLAAQSVAELGTYAAFAATNATPAGSSAARPPVSSEPTEADVLDIATTLVSTARRSKFEAMYVALGQSPTGRSWSPAARAARALALAGRGDQTITAHERATIAWEMIPIVPLEGESTTRSTGELAQSSQRRTTELSMLTGPGFSLAERRPGLAALSARAGEALGSFVAPEPAAPTSSSSREQGQGAVLRAPTAAQELVRTGRPVARHGGGEVEIPAWFEAAARKMFDDRSGVGGSEGMSLAEMTLVTSAPSTQIAASSRGVPSSAASSSPAAGSSAGKQDSAGQQIDVEKIANDAYKHMLVLMDAARSRNGEPSL